ncbi:hypothetical protein [Cognatishimia sp. MH4019]|uniref:hypothetical protein n=1 Tax=Cognatishimia sp. MH4019 TaxID=2854030 RepID=UPI001CD51AAE|nr:hypothetical protein [Cognatishimia sp. MH4019]
MRHLTIEIANIADLATGSGALYKADPDLGELHRPIRKPLEFFKYLRNVYVGHFVSDLTEKTFEWMPQANVLLGSEEQDKQGVVSWFAFETAINTFADPATGHKIFESDTDLNYPPDLTRFLNFLGETVLAAIAYVTRLVSVTRSYIDVPDFEKDMFKLAMKAGETDFAVLTKKRR